MYIIMANQDIKKYNEKYFNSKVEDVYNILYFYKNNIYK